MVRIGADDRHRNVKVLGEWPIDARLFGECAMARPDPTPISQQAFRICTDVGSGAQVAGVMANMVAESQRPFF